ncbi:MAG: VRR-NUC domain-containing protein [Comamonadaceae bacterium]|uniref:VRR-NUC domain-containing protein n=1 Tax=Candidatus Skiveiella danica TaxID=3386177 RepID=UPI00390AC682|nr:VRR-NUC domain-containing protein [Comamonadaceae bacterium]
MILIPDDFELQPAATVPIKKPEAREQARLVACLRGKWSKIEDVSRRPIVFAVPNGGQRDAREAANLKTQGVLAGIPDLTILFPDAFLVFIEMKAPDEGRLSLAQKDLHPHIVGLGYVVIVAYSAEEALAELRKLSCRM